MDQLVIAIAVLLQVAQSGIPEPLLHSNGRAPRAVTAVFAAEAPKIDGNLDDPVWRLATPEGGFRRDVPSDGNPATQPTEVRVAYDKEALYIGARLFDDRPDLVSRRLNRRDSFSSFNDVFFALIDSYHDHRTQFIFGVTPAGERRDAVAGDDGNGEFDIGWDPVWEAKTSIDSLGWVAEFRIPFSQLRFSAAEAQTWGIQFRRDNVRAGEAVDWQWSPKSDPGQVSKYGHLLGLRQIPAPKRLEILPYASSQAQLTDEGLRGAGNPFDDGTTSATGAGLDLKYGVTSDLTLNATINPDFGQVEADPSVVNLTAFETFFQERRPFFVEGSRIFALNANFGSDRFFYSRRVGRSPSQSAFGRAAFVDQPAATSILGAVKLSGQTGGGWSIGAFNAVTGREYARATDQIGAPVRRIPVEPLANYGVLRVKRDLNGGTSGFGFMGTTVNRDASAAAFPSVRSSAYLGAMDFYHRWRQNTYQLDGYVGFASIGGSATSITEAQVSSARYFQRPDQGYLSLDPTRTSLRGWTAQMQFARPTGNWTYGLGANAVSPGFEVNDAGFQQEADRIRTAGYLSRQWLSPTKLARQASVSAQVAQTFNFGGDRLAPTIGLGAFISAHNFSNIYLNFEARGGGLNDRETRGGPVMRLPSQWQGALHYSTDGRKVVSSTVGGTYARDRSGTVTASTFAQINVQSRSRLTFSVTPQYQFLKASNFYIGAYVDPTASATFGNRFLFAPLRQNVFSLETRLNFYFSPVLSLQLYAQPFVATGDFASPSQYSAPRTYRFSRYGTAGSTITTDPTAQSITVDADGPGPSPATTFGNPDFRIRSIRSNLVLRWEYRPGSTLFLVWNQNGFGGDGTPQFQLFKNLGRIFKDNMQNVFLVKANYYVSF